MGIFVENADLPGCPLCLPFFCCTFYLFNGGERRQLLEGFQFRLRFRGVFENDDRGLPFGLELCEEWGEQVE